MRCFTITSASANALFDIAAFLVIGERDVVGPLRMNRGRAGRERLFGIGDGGQSARNRLRSDRTASRAM